MEKAIEDVFARLKRRFAGRVDDATIESAVVSATERLRGAPVRSFVAVFVERRARALIDGGLT
jgi:hypothetical protein